jgi:hypothetical protein
MMLPEMAAMLIEKYRNIRICFLSPDLRRLLPRFHACLLTWRLDLQPYSFYLFRFHSCRFCSEIPTNHPPLLVGSSRYM